MPAKPKLCLWCRSFHISFGTADYSEFTPGDPPEIECYRRVWSIPTSDFTLREYRKRMLTARRCEHFEEDDE